YMAPEQAGGQNQSVGAAADVYALGAILYYCLTGRAPFQGTRLLETLEQVREKEPVPPRLLQPKVPRDLETICLKCLQKEPRKRYAGAVARADALRGFLNGEPILARRTSLPERAWKWAKRNPGRTAVAGILGILFAVSVLVVSLVAVDAMRLE